MWGDEEKLHTQISEMESCQLSPKPGKCLQGRSVIGGSFRQEGPMLKTLFNTGVLAQTFPEAWLSVQTLLCWVGFNKSHLITTEIL